jgi:dihydrofolate synthase/folylpolyglutamate synthase
VIEVGMGGLLDATNVLTPAVSVITKLDLEHTAILGDTLEAIAAQKAGIIKEGIPVVTSPQRPEALAVIEETAARKHARLLVGGRDFQWTGDTQAAIFMGPWGTIGPVMLGLIGPHQLENAATALGAVVFLREAGLTIPDAALRSGLADARLVGRFEIVPPAKVAAIKPALGRVAAPVILDGAHTPLAAEALVRTIQTEYPYRQATLVVGMASDKDVPAFIEGIRPVTKRLIATAAQSVRATSPERIAALAREQGIAATEQPSVAEAVVSALHATPPSDMIVITGSFAVVAEAREALRLPTR